MAKKLLMFAVALAFGAPTMAQQIVNTDADVSVARPGWATGKGPRVAIDAAHANFHTADERYAPFAALLRNDGYRVVANNTPFSAQSLAAFNILVIANAGTPADDGPDEGRSAFSASEIAAVHQWVRRGGSLLLIADHAPFAGAAAALGKAFGIRFRNGYAMNRANRGRDLFLSQSGLANHPIARGAGRDTAITRVRSFTGSAFEAPGAKPLLVLGPGFEMVYPATPFDPQPSDRREPITGLLQGATLSVGKGRVVVMGEAAMFTAQKIMPKGTTVGFGAEGAEQNQRFALNLMHWLSRKRGY